MSTLDVLGLHKSWGSVQVLNGVSLSVGQGEFVSLLGPSGCGKTTILRIIAGLMEPTRGAVHLDGRDITWVPVHKRQIGLVFQSYALFPHQTVQQNVAFGLKRRGVDNATIQKKVAHSLERVHLGHLADRYPHELSGGQQQRVALARALITEPRLLLLDEPLSNLDSILRTEMAIEIKRLQRELGTTTVFVTHDQSEALTMSDRVCLLDRGRIAQLGTPEDIYCRPATAFVATFLGRANILKVVSVDSADGAIVASMPGSDVKIRAAGNHRAGQSALVALRQQAIALAPDRVSEDLPLNHARGTVQFAAFAGASRRFVVRLDAGAEIYVEMAAQGGTPFAVGDRVIASWPPDAAAVLLQDQVEP